MPNGKKLEKADDDFATLLEAMHEGVWDSNIERWKLNRGKVVDWDAKANRSVG